MKVLFVQEQPFLATTIKLILLSKGFELIFRHDVSDPTKVINDIKPDVVVADIDSGEGIDYVTEAKKRKVPVLVISANEKVRQLKKAFEEGADDYIGLPMSITELALRVSLLARAQVA